mgnify:CR=1 FL=1
MGRRARTILSHWKMHIPQKLCEHCNVCALVIASKQMAQRSSSLSDTVVGQLAVVPEVSPKRSPAVTVTIPGQLSPSKVIVTAERFDSPVFFRGRCAPACRLPRRAVRYHFGSFWSI